MRHKEKVQGITACLVVALAASFLAGQYGGPVMLFALLLGMALNFLSEERSCAAGVDFAASSILRVGVALLGVRILLQDVLDLGWSAALIVVIGIVATILFGIALARLLKLDRNLGLLSGGAVAICGMSAALAISSVMPRTRQMEQNVIVTVVMVAAFGSVAMITYPLLVHNFQLDARQASIFLGGAIHDVSHVVGAGYSLTDAIGDSAMITKMLRVALLIPVVACFYLLFHEKCRVAEDGSRRAGEQTVKLPLPWFLVAFVLIAVVTNLGWLPSPLIEGANWLSRWCLVIAIVALGMKTSFEGLLASGWRPMALVLGESVFLGALVMAWAMFF